MSDPKTPMSADLLAKLWKYSDVICECGCVGSQHLRDADGSVVCGGCDNCIGPIRPDQYVFDRETIADFVAHCRAADQARIADLEGVLDEILSKFPSAETIEDLKPNKAGYGYRKYPLDPTPSDADIVRWREALKY